MAIDRDANLQKLVAASPVQRALSVFLRKQLENEREAFENLAASEYQRGRIIMLREIIDFIEDKHP